MLNNLEEYLKSCPGEKEIFNFADYKEAYNFGHSLKLIAMKEEGVNSAEKLKRFDIDISLTTVRINYVRAEELVSC